MIYDIYYYDRQGRRLATFTRETPNLTRVEEAGKDKPQPHGHRDWEFAKAIYLNDKTHARYLRAGGEWTDLLPAAPSWWPRPGEPSGQM